MTITPFPNPKAHRLGFFVPFIITLIPAILPQRESSKGSLFIS